MIRSALLVALCLLAGFGGAAAFAWSGLGDRQVEKYLLANPDLLPRMVQAYERQQAEQKLSSAGADLREPFAGAVLGNPAGTRTLIKFTDYNCGYCRASSAEVAKLVAQDPDLKVIIREWPIFEGSERVASMALAAAKQGKYSAFHSAVFAGGDTSEAGLKAAAQASGVDFDQAVKDAGDPQIAYELARNTAMAQELGFTGTPSWVIGDTILEGAVPAEALSEALSNSGQSGTS
ncbi:DsbA family protein [Parerythrobacter jejuensis]|uniref:Thioredoxin domain-containing protein n=2 Tax=Parerythrobacter jejuensis TaxID=795812 RepID=A0A845AQ39_9SPHN|nr:DsbA family protein [Parerythrobacter jejuensis]MXP31015.1 thioredoxin domain-containing protein [Parerythrobacter jejuensis]MXP33775.1 thioredoxin domain-containing protein [Parerythrobacter jejuensis]